MHTLQAINELRHALAAHRRAGARIALVPTMGNLHAGHMALVERARARADIVVASLFVNPMQFGPNEDLDAYPRTLKADQTKLRDTGCDLLFTPTSQMLYPAGLEAHTRVQVPGVGDTLCGRARPGHFDGVSTVVTILFNLVQPDIAFFGEKDYQQLAVIRKLVADLHLPIEIVGVPTQRAEDGLALSSRNGYLSAEQRAVAPALYRTLLAAKAALERGDPAPKVIDDATRYLAEAGFTPDYVELAGADLGPVTPATREAVLLAAARLGPARLIDNIAVTLG